MSALVDDLDNNLTIAEKELERRLNKRSFHIMEVIKTERTYVDRIKKVSEYIIGPLNDEKILTSLEIEDQFSNWVLIQSLHENFLFKLERELKSVDNNDPNLLPLGRLFVEFAPSLTAADYGEYFIKFENARNARAKWLSSNLPKGRKFENFLNEKQDQMGLYSTVDNHLLFLFR